ncbi:MAG: DUF2752 domain-containing protein [Frankiaceae bacterium]|jgi:hypothetical protein|nr:DUF2752 domain-containing protein [Frankiaceae bacterium]
MSRALPAALDSAPDSAPGQAALQADGAIGGQPLPGARGGLNSRAVAARCAAVLGVAAGLAYVGLRDPHDPSVLMPRCLFHLATGLNCPACGGLRMTHDLLRGDLSGAVGSNAFLMALAPVLLALYARAALLRRRGRSVPLIGRRTRVAIIAAAGGWFVVRNIAGW